MRDPQIPEPHIDPTAVISPGSHIYGDVRVGAHSFVLFGVVMRAEIDNITVGTESNIQDNAVLHCDEDLPCHVGNRVTIGHSAVVHGARLGNKTLIGIGAKILNGAVVGEGAWVGAGAVLTEGSQIPPWTLAMGTPARPVRDLTEDEVGRANDGIVHYLQLATMYREIFSETD